MNNETPPDRKELDIIKNHVDQMIGHFDSVQVFATLHKPISEGGTVNFRWGAGNYFARFGLCKSWVLEEEGDAFNRVLHEKDK